MVDLGSAASRHWKAATGVAEARAQSEALALPSWRYPYRSDRDCAAGQRKAVMFIPLPHYHTGGVKGSGWWWRIRGIVLAVRGAPETAAKTTDQPQISQAKSLASPVWIYG